jgi:hypothetical protein
MQRSGHFEFGLDRRPINLGDQDRVQNVRDAWASGDEVRGWSLYWDMVHRYLGDLLETNSAVSKASIVVRFDELCEHPGQVLQRVFDHCELTDSRSVIDKFVTNIRTPNYYQNPFKSEELSIIRHITDDTARRWTNLKNSP